MRDFFKVYPLLVLSESESEKKEKLVEMQISQIFLRAKYSRCYLFLATLVVGKGCINGGDRLSDDMVNTCIMELSFNYTYI